MRIAIASTDKINVDHFGRAQGFFVYRWEGNDPELVEYRNTHINPEEKHQWAEGLMPTLRSCWTDPNPGNYFHGATACLSCLLVAGRYQDLLDLLALDRKPFWQPPLRCRGLTGDGEEIRGFEIRGGIQRTQPARFGY